MISIQQIIQEIEFLPPFSKVAQQAMQLLQKPDFNLRKLVEIIRFDPALTANILKTVNSAFFSRGKEISDLFTATSLLGRNKIHNIITITASKAYFPSKLAGYEENPGEIWEHSLAVALISEKLLFLEPSLDASEVFTAALLHDIGKVVLSQFVDEQFTEIQKYIDAGTDFLTAEKRVLGFSHAEVGATVLKHWKFSSNVIQTAKSYHVLDSYENPVVNLVALADNIAMQLGMVSVKDAMSYTANTELLKHYNLSTTQFELILSDALDSTKETIQKLKGV